MIKDKLVLPMAEPIVRTYNHYAHICAMLSGKKEALPWIYSHFIQLFMNKDLSLWCWGDYYFPFPYETKCPSLCPWIMESRIKRNYFDQNPERLIEFIQKEINDETYLYMYLNHYYLRLPEIGSEDKCHDALVYGIDCENKIMYVADVFKNGKYEKKEIPFEDFLNAFYHVELPQDGDFMNNMIYEYKVKDQCSYEFNVANIEYSIKQYYASERPEYWSMYNQGNAPKICFGLDVYESLAKYLEDICTKKEKMIEITHFFLLKEHKELMVKRFQYLCEIGVYRMEDMKEIIDGYIDVMDRCQVILLRTIKYLVISDVSLLKKAIDELRLNHVTEMQLLEKYLDTIKL